MVRFTPKTPGYIKNPELENKIHCVAFVIDGSTTDVMSNNILQKIKDLQIRLNQRGNIKIDNNFYLPVCILVCI